MLLLHLGDAHGHFGADLFGQGRPIQNLRHLDYACFQVAPSPEVATAARGISKPVELENLGAILAGGEFTINEAT